MKTIAALFFILCGLKLFYYLALCFTIALFFGLFQEYDILSQIDPASPSLLFKLQPPSEQ